MTVDASCHRDTAESLGVSTDQLPALVLYAPAKRRLAQYVGAWSSPAMKDWLVSLRSTQPLSDVPVWRPECSASPEDIEAMDDSVRNRIDIQPLL